MGATHAEHPRLDLLRQAPGFAQAKAIVRELRERHGAPWLCYGVERGQWIFGLRDPETRSDVRIFGVDACRLGGADLRGSIALAGELLAEMNAKIADHALRQASADADPLSREVLGEREAAVNQWLRQEARRRWGDCAEADAIHIDYGGRRG